MPNAQVSSGIKITIKCTPELTRMAEQVYELQDGCNSGGLARMYLEHIARLNGTTEITQYGTAVRNQHPIVVLWLDKLCSLARIQDLGNARVMDAYDAIALLRAGKDCEWTIVP